MRRGCKAQCTLGLLSTPRKGVKRVCVLQQGRKGLVMRSGVSHKGGLLQGESVPGGGGGRGGVQSQHGDSAAGP